MSKFIIDNRTNLFEECAFERVLSVVRSGPLRKDRTAYMFKDGIVVIARKIKSSETFIVLPPKEVVNE